MQKAFNEKKIGGTSGHPIEIYHPRNRVDISFPRISVI
jgi:hypothetical protein